MTHSIPITVIILSRNEAVNLSRCLSALRPCADVLVVDDGSVDDSPAIAQAAGARVVEHRFVSFADQRNWAMHAGGPYCDWTLHLDADEVLTPEALKEMGDRLASLRQGQVGYLARKVMMEARWLRYSAEYPVYVPRLVHRKGPRFVMNGHGEVIEASVDAPVFFQAPMLHYPFSKGWTDWYERHRHYAEAEASRLLEGSLSFRYRDVWACNRVQRRRALRSLSFRLPGRPVWRFLYAFVLRRGFLDGGQGFRFCLAMARYEIMINQNVRRQGRVRRSAHSLHT